MIFKHSLDPFCNMNSSTYSDCLVPQLICIIFPFLKKTQWRNESKGLISSIVRADLKSLSFRSPQNMQQLPSRGSFTSLWKAKITGYIISRDAHGGSTPSRSTSHYHNVSIILIGFIFADNNCKYNLTNYFTHNILYMKSWLNRLCIINWHIY